MILYYKDRGKFVEEWYYDNLGQRVNIGMLVKGPNWARWLKGAPLSISFSDGRQMVVERMVEG